MDRHDRLNAILALLLEREAVRVDEIVSELGVSAATARRDLDALADQQLLTRTRGGAATHPGSSDLPLRYRGGRKASEKARIARAAAATVGLGEVVALNGGTTTTEVAREIATRPDLQPGRGGNGITVVTNAVNIAGELTVRPHVRVVVTGGVARPQSYELTGPLAGLILDQITVDTLFLGVDGLDLDRGATATDESEAAVNAALVRAARRTVIVADSGKLGKSSFARICPLENVDALITDSGAEGAQVEAFRAAGLEVTLV
ncbi:DeoR/GlpR family DNA-binding transcription regulator [Georgenia subflava]|uniref:DeoR family transcriptional regulator n=1 Tax=Georgenia subflava TaxID=1622177 RepID=A0A6N7EP03_9MICO|nr:DeoR/GlpR family DNA-binding transcription regulator [Georgenia subflava]MPV38597.1 DeoR family transcriptional regulator [Georgenia subflava]